MLSLTCTPTPVCYHSINVARPTRARARERDTNDRPHRDRHLPRLPPRPAQRRRRLPLPALRPPPLPPHRRGMRRVRELRGRAERAGRPRHRRATGRRRRRLLELARPRRAAPASPPVPPSQRRAARLPRIPRIVQQRRCGGCDRWCACRHPHTRPAVAARDARPPRRSAATGRQRPPQCPKPPLIVERQQRAHVASIAPTSDRPAPGSLAPVAVDADRH